MTQDGRRRSIAGSRARSFAYDALGNLKTATGWNGNRSYGYDGLNRLSTLTNAGVTTGYAYNGLGQRAQKSGSVAYTYVYTPDGALLGETSNGGTSLTTGYIWLGSTPVGLIRGGTVYYIHDDHLSRPDTVTNSSGSIVWQAQNTAFDRTVTTNGIGGLNIGFPGQYPIGLAGGLNTYLYAGGNPILMIDPMGLSFGSAAGCFAKGAAVGAVGAVVVGVVAVGAVTIGAPVAVVTAALGGLAIVGGVVTGANIGLGVANGNWDSVAYNAGAAVGGFAAGGAGGRAIAEGVNGVPSPPWSLGSDAAQGYNSSLGSIGQWLGTGPNPGSAAATAGAAGAGAASASGCGCGS